MYAKKYICLVFFMIFSKLFLFAQLREFTLEIKIKGCNKGYIELRYLHNKNNVNKKYDVKTSGEVTIARKIAYPEMVYLILNDSLHTDDFFISPGVQNIVLDATSREKFYNSVKSGVSPINDEYRNKYLRLIQPYYDSLDNWYVRSDSLRSVYPSNFPDSILLDLNKSFSIITRQMDSVKRQYFFQNSSSYVSLWMLYEASYAIVNLNLVFDCFKRLDAKLTKTTVGQDLHKRLTAQKAFLTGNTFPDLVLKDSSENKIYLAQIIKKKYTFLDFWFGHCTPCIAQFPEIKRIYNKYRNDGFEVISISVDIEKNKKEWKKIIAEKELSWKQYWDVNAIQANKLYIHSFPTSFLLDSSGKIIDKDVTLESLEEFLIEHAFSANSIGSIEPNNKN